MKKKIKKIFKKSLSIFMIVGILLSSFSGIPIKIPKVEAMATVSGDKIIEVARSYESWGYWEVGTCTGLVTRTLNKLGIGESVVGIHPYNIDNPQPEGTGARYAPDAMYKNAMNHPEDAKLIWQGYVKDIVGVADQLKNGDLVIQRIQDKANYNGSGHVGLIRKYGTNISMYGANGEAMGIGDAVLTTKARGTSYNVSGDDYISIFRLTKAEPKYEKLTSTKTATETVEVSFKKTDIDTGKVLEGVTVDFYRDDVKFASATTDANGIAKVTSVQNFESTSSLKEYCTNYDELDEEGKQAVIDRGAYKYLTDAQADADSEAQIKANEQASQNHRFTVIETQTKTKYWLDDNNKTVSDSTTGSGSISLNLSNKRVLATAKLKKVDFDSTIAQNSATLEDALYGLFAKENILDPADGSIIYRAGEEVARGRTKNAEITIDNLYLGKYFWKELTASEGYKLSPITYDVNLEYAGQTVNTVTSKTTVSEEVITANFEIEKVITTGEESGEVEKEEGAEFIVVAKKYVDKYGSIEEAYKHKDEFTNKEYDHLVTNSQGVAKSKNLAFGDFSIKQIKGKIDTELVKDEWTFSVKKENQETIKYIVNNRLFTSYVKLVKKDADTGKTITMSNTTFKIVDLSTGEYLTQKVGDKVLEEWHTSKDGMFTLPLEVKAGSFKLVEVSSPDLYLINNDGVEFKVTNTNIIETDVDGDPILTVTMLDKPVKGIINIEKQGEMLDSVVQDEEGNYQFIYKNQCLSGMTAEIKAREDIIDPADGSILFEKGTIVDTITTGSTCENYSDLLPLGKYTVYEKNSPFSMVKDTKEYNVDLTFKDNQTEVIIENVSITNERQKVELDVNKLDKDDETPIQGVVFGLYAKKDIYKPRKLLKTSTDNNLLIEAGTLIETATSNEEGKVIFNVDLPVTLDEETYFEIKEIKSLDGYYLNEEAISLNVKYQGQDTKVVKNEFTIYNEAIKNYILVNKVDSLTMENIISKDFEFSLCTDAECKNVVSKYNANQDNGTALVDIKFGTWFIKESSAPLGYALSPEVVKVELNNEGLFVNDKKVETDEDLTYSIIYQDSLLPVIQTGIDNNPTIYIVGGGIALTGAIALLISLSKKKKKK